MQLLLVHSHLRPVHLKCVVDSELFGEDIAEAATLDRETKYYENKVKLIKAKEEYEKAIAKEVADLALIVKVEKC